MESNSILVNECNAAIALICGSIFFFCLLGSQGGVFNNMSVTFV